MPRKSNRRNKSRQKSVSYADRSRVIPLSIIRSLTGATTYAYPMQPGSFDTRGVAEADGFELYRIVKLRFRLVPAFDAGPPTICAAWIAGITDTTPPTLATLAEVPLHALMGGGQSTPTAWVNVPSRTLKGYETWYKTIAGTPDPAQEIQGYVFVAASGTGAATLEIQAVFEFKQPAPVGSTPQMRREKQILAQFRHAQWVQAEGSRIMLAASLTKQTLPPQG